MSDFEELAPIIDLSGQRWPRQKNYRGAGHRTAWNEREFIAFDGEGIDTPVPLEVGTFPDGTPFYLDEAGNPVAGYVSLPQNYALLANSKGQTITARVGETLSTVDCLEFLLTVKEQFPKSVFIGFSFNYDVNQILADLPPACLEVVGAEERCCPRHNLHKFNEIHWPTGYFLRWYPRKSFYVKHKRSRRAAILYDPFGYFATSFAQVCDKYLGENDPLILAGKAARGSFTWDQLDGFMTDYCVRENQMFVRVMDQVRKDLHGADIDLQKWNGPGAVAEKLLERYAVPIERNLPDVVLDCSQYAYAGGRFEQFWLGRYAGRVYEYDINSAYPWAATFLPDLSRGYWEEVKHFSPGSFGLWRISYRGADILQRRFQQIPQPFYCRDPQGIISYPHQVESWVWTPEAEMVPAAVTPYLNEDGEIYCGWVFHPDDDARPFDFLCDLYSQRLVWKDPAHYNPSERALKTGCNSIYGKLAQSVGWDRARGLPPRWHQLEYAGYITSKVRAKMYQAMMQLPHAILAAETDAVFSTVPLELELGEGLGQWEVKEYDEVTYLQSGLYYATKSTGEVVCKYRGLDRALGGAYAHPLGLDYDTVLRHLQKHTGDPSREIPPLSSRSSRFIGLGEALSTESAVWRSWKTQPRKIALETGAPDAKRYHLSSGCPLCAEGVSLYDRPHPMRVGGYSGTSYAKHLPWREVPAMASNEDPDELLEAEPAPEDLGVWV